MAVQIESLTDQDIAEIRDLTDTHVRSILGHDPDAFLAACTDDITFLPPDQPVLAGRSACRAFLEGFPTPATFTAEVHEVEGHATLAYSRGSTAATFDDGTATTFKWLAIHRKQADGSWKMARDAWNTDEIPDSQRPSLDDA